MRRRRTRLSSCCAGMPNNSAHLAQIERNEDLVAHLAASRSALPAAVDQWTAVLQFYIAVHWIESQLAKHGMSSSSHGQRRRMMESVWKHQGNALNAYADLETLSRRARYLCKIPSSQELAEATVALNDVMSGIV